MFLYTENYKDYKEPYFLPTCSLYVLTEWWHIYIDNTNPTFIHFDLSAAKPIFEEDAVKSKAKRVHL